MPYPYENIPWLLCHVYNLLSKDGTRWHVYELGDNLEVYKFVNNETKDVIYIKFDPLGG